MSTPVSSIRNLGPATESAFARAGIHSAEHFIGYYAIVMGLQGRPWNDCHGAEKAALRKRFDALKASVRPSRSTALEAALDAIGVVAPRRTGSAQDRT